jgi:hypothetical protein
MSKSEWIVKGALIGSVLLVAGTALLTFILGRVAPHLGQWNKAPAIPAFVFYGFTALCGILYGAYFGYIMSNTAPEQRLSSIKVLIVLVPLCIMAQRFLGKLMG